MNERKTTLVKNKEGYGYKYTELAEINKYCEENNIIYYQEVETCEINGKDYIVTYICENGEITKHRGCQIVDAILQGIKNPVQQYGSSLTYCRRYSLLMALGLATEDDDGASLNQKITKEQALEYVFDKGKYKGKSITELYEKDTNYLQWWLDQGNNEEIKQMIMLITDLKPTPIPSEEEQQERLELITDINNLVELTNTDYEKLLSHYKVKSNGEMTTEQLKDAVEKLKEKLV